MSDLFWPGDERAGGLMSPTAWLEAMVAVEQAWVDALAAAGVAPAAPDLAGLVGAGDLEDLAAGAESGGNPVLGLVALLRARADGAGAAWVHRGLTSQDVVDTGLVLCLRDVVTAICAELRAQVAALAALADDHRGTVMTGRTLTQAAVPVSFGLKAAGWLTGVLDAADRLDALTFPAQFGGAAGTHAATTELMGDPAAALRIAEDAATRLELRPSTPWHTSRAPVTSYADALVACTDAWGRVAGDVLTLSRPEIAELAEPAGRGGSSTMPHKRNPVLSTLLRRAALSAPPLASTTHVAAALAEDERPAGGWHAEWPALQALGRRTAVAASQATELLAGLHVDADRMAANARAAWDDLTAERASIARFAGAQPSTGDYLGANDLIIDAARQRAQDWLETHP
ncbi:3-carboxy-cis,cis-muconate cycloisomerase [Nocardioides maradonensis]